MAKNPDIRILQCPEQAFRHLLLRLLEKRMNAGDDHVHLRQHFIGEVDFSIAKNIDLDPGQNTDAAFHPRIHLANALHMFERALVIESVDHGQILRVIGDGDIFVTAGEAASAISRMVFFPSVAWVCMCTSPRRSLCLDQPWADDARRRLRFLPGFRAAPGQSNPCPAPGRSPLQSQRRRPAIVQTRQSIFAQRVAPFQRSLAERNIMHFRAGEVLQGSAIAALGKKRTSTCSPLRKRKLTLFWPLASNSAIGG